MFSNSKFAIIGVTAVALASGCGGASTPPAQEPPSFAAFRQNELQSERQEFITEARERLDELENEIGRLEVQLKHESQFVDADQRAEWSQDLFEKKQEQQRLRAELQRAQNVSAEEWEEMRGTLGGAIDTMEAGVQKLNAEVMSALGVGGGEAEEPMAGKLRADMGLCPLMVQGIDSDVQREGNNVVLIVTTDDTNELETLRTKARELSTHDTYVPATDGSTAPSGVVAVRIQAQDVQDGIKLVFTPNDRNDVDKLYGQISQDASHLDDGDCEIEGGRTSMR